MWCSYKIIKKRNIRKWFLPFAFSLMVHSLIFIAINLLMFYWISRSLRKPAVEYQIDFCKVPSQYIKEQQTPEKIPIPCPKKTIKKIEQKFPKITKKDVKDLFKRTHEFSKSIKNKISNLKSLVTSHNRFVSQKGQQEIIGVLGKNYKRNDFVPRAKKPAGEFNWDDFTIFKMKKIDKPVSGYVITFVDRAGRTTVKKFYGVEAQPFHTLYNAYKLCGRSRMLKSLFEYTLKSVPSLLK